MTDVLGSLSFLETPDVNGALVLTATSGVSSVAGTANQIAVIGALPSYTIGLADNPILPGSGSLTIPSGTTAQRPVSPTVGIVRYNSTLGYNEVYSGVYWGPFGRVLQQVSGTIPSQTSTTQTPLDATPPLSTEGSQIWSAVFTPMSTTSRTIITYSMNHTNANSTRSQIASVFSGTLNIGTIVTACASAGFQYPVFHQIVYTSGTLTPITFSCRVGSSGAGTWYVNSAATNTLGGTMASRFLITEVE